MRRPLIRENEVESGRLEEAGVGDWRLSQKSALSLQPVRINNLITLRPPKIARAETGRSGRQRATLRGGLRCGDGKRERNEVGGFLPMSPIFKRVEKYHRTTTLSLTDIFPPLNFGLSGSLTVGLKFTWSYKICLTIHIPMKLSLIFINAYKSTIYQL